MRVKKGENSGLSVGSGPASGSVDATALRNAIIGSSGSLVVKGICWEPAW